MMEEVYLAEHLGGAMTQKWKFREGFLQEVALELWVEGWIGFCWARGERALIQAKRQQKVRGRREHVGMPPASVWLEHRSQIMKGTLFHMSELECIILETMASIKGFGVICNTERV